MTIPLPALALMRKPIRNTLKRAKPFALFKTEFGTTPSRPLLGSTKAVREGRMVGREKIGLMRMDRID